MVCAALRWPSCVDAQLDAVAQTRRLGAKPHHCGRRPLFFEFLSLDVVLLKMPNPTSIGLGLCAHVAAFLRLTCPDPIPTRI